MSSFKLFLIISIQADLFQAFPADKDDTQVIKHLNNQVFGTPDRKVGQMIKTWTPSSKVNPEELGTYFEADILIPMTDGKNGVIKDSLKWPDKTIPYVFHKSVSSQDKEFILEAIDRFHKETCVKFKPRDKEKDFLSFRSSDTGCWSAVGKIGKEQIINLQSGGCTRVGTIQHELMHTVGFDHEHSRDDRDKFIIIKEENIEAEALPNFVKSKPGTSSAYGAEYDKGSLMHYSAYAFSKNEKQTIEAKSGGSDMMGQRVGFSASDISRINAMYKCGVSRTSGEH